MHELSPCQVMHCQVTQGLLTVPQAMWFPTFDKIHGLQKKYAESTNVQLTESKQKYVHEDIFIYT